MHRGVAFEQALQTHKDGGNVLEDCVVCFLTPPPLYKLRQCTESLRSLRPLQLGQGRSLRATHTTTDTHVCARMV